MLGSQTDDKQMREPAGDPFVMEERTLKSRAEGSMSEPTVEAPMETQTIQTATRIAPQKRCTHSRLIDEIRTKSGKRTGKVRCLECGTIIEDPYQVPQ
jgi:hypothetical protein